MDNIEARVKKIVAEQLGVAEADIKNDSSFVEDLGADSLDNVELVMALEEEFECEIPTKKQKRLPTCSRPLITCLVICLSKVHPFLRRKHPPVFRLPCPNVV